MNRLLTAALFLSLATTLHAQKPPSGYEIQDQLTALKGGPPAPGATPTKPLTDAERGQKPVSLQWQNIFPDAKTDTR
jgi:hypothetical protein